VVVFFTYGRVAMRYFGLNIPYHAFISFGLFILGVVVFVLTLKKATLKYQFGVFAMTQLTLLLVVVQSTFLVVNMFQGLIWFILPALLIVSNDVWAYFWGFFFGQTPLIKLSPKKTWEGFIGGAAMTLLTGFFLARLLSEFDLMVCPKKDFSLEYPHCTHDLPYIPVQKELPSFLANLIGRSTIGITPMQWHGVALATFASLLAPFGGFFASGFKRAFKFKDFGTTIPGHGGFTDRMDCQIMMSLFAFVYYWSFVQPRQDADYVFDLFAALASDDKLRVYKQITEHLVAHHLIGAGAGTP